MVVACRRAILIELTPVKSGLAFSVDIMPSEEEGGFWVGVTIAVPELQ
jgi:hypothetical protein